VTRFKHVQKYVVHILPTVIEDLDVLTYTKQSQMKVLLSC